MNEFLRFNHVVKALFLQKKACFRTGVRKLLPPPSVIELTFEHFIEVFKDELCFTIYNDAE